MLPLTLVPRDEAVLIHRVGGADKVRKHLEGLGFVAGARVRVVQEMNGNLILDVKDARIGISREMAQKVFVDKEES